MALALGLSACGGAPEVSRGPGEAPPRGASTPCPVAAPPVSLPRQGISARELGVLVNTEDPLSVSVADYYVARRGIPEANVVELAFPVQDVMPPADFPALQAQVEAALGPEIQGLALTWTQPYRVGCMSATAAFALGFDRRYCNTSPEDCGPTQSVDYFNSESARPFTDHGLRPAMMVAAASYSRALELIDRGVAADDTRPRGRGFLLRTTDAARSVRWPAFLTTLSQWEHDGGLSLTYTDNDQARGWSNVLTDADDVLFYFTGLEYVDGITSNRYLPGALADHLTSYAGMVPDSTQMSALRWLEAGATASYGAVVEPCNFPQKFPDTTTLLPHYFRGSTALEAYWKSVAWPGEGNFIGEPLARPWGELPVTYEGCTLTIETSTLRPFATYELQESVSPGGEGPWTTVIAGISLREHRWTTIEYGAVKDTHYRLVLVAD